MKSWEIVLIVLVMSSILASPSFASIPDANVVKGRFEISGGTGSSVELAKDNAGNKARYQWTSIALDYGIDDETGIGIGFWGQNYLDNIQYDKSLLGDIANALFPIITYVDTAADIHLRKQFDREQDGAIWDAAWIYGAGVISGRLSNGEPKTYLFPEIGVGINKKLIKEWLIARVNLVAGVPMGVELACKPTNNLEITVGLNRPEYPMINAKLIF